MTGFAHADHHDTPAAIKQQIAAFIEGRSDSVGKIGEGGGLKHEDIAGGGFEF
ncbi:MAG: hypothetical protein DHS20C01_11660 [marine bacterium B5-7]|nr:MAG: hypothetical protein DHS20C01_11660 [marine bacterium B5-7]